MPVIGAAHSPCLFWDGRKDSLWSQALGPAGGRGRARRQPRRASRRLVQAHYQDAVRGAVRPAADARQAAGRRVARSARQPSRRPGQRCPSAAGEAVNRVFANMGKAIAAYETHVSLRRVALRPLRPGHASPATAAARTCSRAQEVRGLRLFIGKGQCVTCHNGPLLTDQHFHNTGVPPRDRGRPDRGRADGLTKVLQDEFNCLGRVQRRQAGAVRGAAVPGDRRPGPARRRSRRPACATWPSARPTCTPGSSPRWSRSCSTTRQSPKAVLGHSELAQPGEKHADRQTIRLTAAEVQDVAAFLGTLTGPVVQAK